MEGLGKFSMSKLIEKNREFGSIDVDGIEVL